MSLKTRKSLPILVTVVALSVLLLLGAVVAVESCHPFQERRVRVVPGREEPVVDGEPEVVVVQLHQRRPQLRRLPERDGEGVGLRTVHNFNLFRYLLEVYME